MRVLQVDAIRAALDACLATDEELRALAAAHAAGAAAPSSSVMRDPLFGPEAGEGSDSDDDSSS